MTCFKDNKIKEIECKINSLIELHMHNFIDDQIFYADFKFYTDLLENANQELVVINETELYKNEEDKEPTELNDVIKNLQCQLMVTKSDNIESFKTLVKQTESSVIEQQEIQLQKRTDYITNSIKPLKEIYANMYEDCASLE
jgi:hypothetical protein